MSEIIATIDYHRRTKHHPHRMARSMGFLDWQNQPDPFRRYEGAPLIPLERDLSTEGPAFDQLQAPRDIPCSPLEGRLVARLLFDALAISAWKQQGASRWSLRCNPSSGNLHPTEAHLLLPAVAGLTEAPGLFHYSPWHHGLERRIWLSEQRWRGLTAGLPPSSILLGLTSILWREAWKYGERCFRYCQLDTGHAVAAVAYAAAAMGWETRLLERTGSQELAALLGVADQRGPEAEHPELLLLISPHDQPASSPLARWRPDLEAVEFLRAAELAGTPNPLSAAHHDWPVLEEIARATERPAGAPSVEAEKIARPRGETLRIREQPGRRILRARRSAVDMDGQTTLEEQEFFRLLARLMPDAGVPFEALPWSPAIHLLLFIHRVDGVPPGMYLLARDAAQVQALQSALHDGFAWTAPSGCPPELPLYCLSDGDWHGVARDLSCQQDIASDGVFAAAMLTDFEATLQRRGAWAYRQLYWEAGLLGQALYLEAEAAGLRGTGIGCFYDDLVHQLLGLQDERYQVLYHFTVGGPVIDQRLADLPAYGHLDHP